jgi:hypothetical protein
VGHVKQLGLPSFVSQFEPFSLVLFTRALRLEALA